MQNLTIIRNSLPGAQTWAIWGAQPLPHPHQHRPQPRAAGRALAVTPGDRQGPAAAAAASATESIPVICIVMCLGSEINEPHRAAPRSPPQDKTPPDRPQRSAAKLHAQSGASATAPQTSLGFSPAFGPSDFCTHIGKPPRGFPFQDPLGAVGSRLRVSPRAPQEQSLGQGQQLPVRPSRLRQPPLFQGCKSRHGAFFFFCFFLLGSSSGHICVLAASNAAFTNLPWIYLLQHRPLN